MIKKILGKCLSAYLIVYLAFGAVFIFADDWDDFDDFVMPEFQAPEPAPEPQPQFHGFESAPAQPEFQQFESAAEQPPFHDIPSPAVSEFTPPPVFEPTFHEPLQSFDSFFSGTPDAAEAGSNYVTIIRSDRLHESVFQDAVIEGLQFTVEPTGVEDEIMVNCYFIFRDRPTSFFYELNRKEKKIIFEFADARTGFSPIVVEEQAPISGIIIEELQVDANRDMKGLNPEWHNYIRITMNLTHIPVISVNNESTIVFFGYKWTTNPEKYPEYIEVDKFPLVFWLSAGGLGAIGLGLLTYFLIPKKEKPVDNTLSTSDLPQHPNP